MSPQPPAYCLDLSRLASRAGARLTGVDRVELAYLDEFLARPAPFFALVRVARGQVLLDRQGAQDLRARVLGEVPLGPRDAIALASRRLTPAQARMQADVRRLGLARAPLRRLGALLRRHLPPGTHFYATGHSNLSTATFAALHQLPEAEVHVLLHDCIPLDTPEFQRPGTPERFAVMLEAIRQGADRIICNSADTEAALHRHADGPVPPTCVAHLGVNLPTPDPSTVPAKLPQRGHFVALGTLEPRKNHALLLGLWQDMALRALGRPGVAPDATLPPDPTALSKADVEAIASHLPHLVLIGRRGWENQEVFDWLDRSPLVGVAVHEAGPLPDSASAALLQSARALLFPSFAEGFGLPPVEAKLLNTPVICADLPVLREVLGNGAVYLDPNALYQWRDLISAPIGPDAHASADLSCFVASTEDTLCPASAEWLPPSWADHFKRVLGPRRP